MEGSIDAEEERKAAEIERKAVEAERKAVRRNEGRRGGGKIAVAGDREGARCGGGGGGAVRSA